MIKVSNIDAFKLFAELQVNNIPGGIAYIVIEGDTITWSLSSEGFDLEILKTGNKINSFESAVKAVENKTTATEKIPRSVYGIRLIISSTPIMDESGEAVGAVSIAIPELHPVASAFNDFAPILSDMFPDGSFIYLTDLEKVAYRQPSKKFDIPSIEAGYELKEDDVATKAIKTKQHVAANIDAGKYGVPVYISNFPLFDIDNVNEIVATLGIILPKITAAKLRTMSDNLENSLSGVSAAIEELAASATQIHTNEQELNRSIAEILNLSEEINEVSSFIKEIADETKMLGLNAAIEAARAGEAGKGFGVVAEEIRKLSDQSKSTVPKIKKLTDSIKEKVEAASKMGHESMHSSQEQAAATEEITASIEEISGLAEELNTVAQQV